jgi:hypothetical protein
MAQSESSAAGNDREKWHNFTMNFALSGINFEVTTSEWRIQQSFFDERGGRLRVASPVDQRSD